MPRKRRLRKIRRRKQKPNKQPCNTEVDLENTPTNSVPNFGTPSPQPETNSQTKGDDSSVKSTPVTHRRNLSRKEKRASNGSFNVTNLNILFDSSNIYNTPKTCTKVYVQREKTPNLSPPLRTINTPNIIVNNVDVITPQCDMTKFQTAIRTPKVNRVSFLEDTTPNNRKVNNLSNKINNFGSAEVNINPYLKKDNVKMYKDGGTLSELSFFSPQLFNLKSSSTPIEKLSKNYNFGFSAETLLKESNLEVSGKTVESCNITKQSTSMDSMNKTPPSLAIERVTKSNIIPVKNGSSPSKLNQSVCNKSVNVSDVKLSSRSPNGSIHRPRISTCEKVFSQLKKYSRVSIKWSYRLAEICSQIGLSLINRVTTSRNVEDKGTVCNFEKTECKCEDYRQDITVLNIKVQRLNDELASVRLQMAEHKNNGELIKELKNDLTGMKEEMSRLAQLRAELESLKDQIKCNPAPSSAPPPPPPPPPLPPPLPLTSLTNNTLKISKKSENVKGTAAGAAARPIISLDDILRVKLKKPQYRSSSVTPVRGGNQSIDVLSQVKLKPSCRPAIRALTPERRTDCQKANMTTSPYSSLSRMLITDNSSVWKVKRLQKVNGYSLDSVYRRSPLMSNRERDNT